MTEEFVYPMIDFLRTIRDQSEEEKRAKRAKRKRYSRNVAKRNKFSREEGGQHEKPRYKSRRPGQRF